MDNNSLMGALRRKKLKSPDQYMNGEWKDEPIDGDGLAPKLEEKSELENIEPVEKNDEEVSEVKSAKEVLGFEPLESTKGKTSDDGESSAMDFDPAKASPESLDAMVDENTIRQLDEGMKPRKGRLMDYVQQNILKKRKKGK